MKVNKSRLKFIILIVFFLFLTGCSRDTIEHSKYLDVIDISSEYRIDPNLNLRTYTYNKDQNISYVNISEFITFMDKGLEPLNIRQDKNVLMISFTIDIPNEFQEFFDKRSKHTYVMRFDAEKDIITLNDVEMFTFMNREMTSQYETDLFLTDIDIDRDDVSLEINLKKYDMNIVRSKEQFYIPLYLANLFLTGECIEVYEMNDEIYVFDSVTGFEELLNNYEINNHLTAANINKHTKNYLALYFDHFYGLKKHHNIDSYLDILDDYDFENQDDFDSLHRELESFLNSHNDLHTYLISAGHMNEDYELGKHLSKKETDFIQIFNDNKCSLREQEISYKSSGELFIIEVNQFSIDTRLLLKPAMREARNYDEVMIDLSCNTGGVIIGVIELLSYMTDEEIPLFYTNQATSLKITDYYDTTVNDALEDKNIYVYTTPVTYSAANLFTSIVKDKDLALIIGEKTSGGASVISTTVLPSGAIIVNSSNTTFVNDNDEIIEDGIEPDIIYNGEIGEYVEDIFKLSSSIEVNKNANSEGIDFSFDVNLESDLIEVLDYYLLTYDTKGIALLSKERINNNQFSLERTDGRLVKNIKISVQYKVDGLTNMKEDVLYSDYVDDHYDNFDLNATELPVDLKLEAYSHSVTDKDVFKFSIIEAGLYQIQINDENGLYDHTLYDEDGNLLEVGYDFNLTPGTYYIVVSPNYKGYYWINIKGLSDD